MRCRDTRRMPIYLKLVRNPALYLLLERGDHELAALAGSRGCGKCGGPLHHADYPRKPRGLGDVPPGYWKRLSYCCGREGCRARCTPPSMRFLGRRFYVGAVVVLATAMLHGLNPRRVEELRALFGMDVRTLRRWREWWLDAFVRSPTWEVLRAMLVPALDVSILPLSLVQRVCKQPDVGKMAVLMRGLGPLTTRSCPM